MKRAVFGWSAVGLWMCIACEPADEGSADRGEPAGSTGEAGEPGTGTSDTSGSLEDDGDSGTGDPGATGDPFADTTLDYDVCGATLRDPECEGIECAEEPGAVPFIEQLEDALVAAGLGDVSRVAWGIHVPEFDLGSVGVQFQVDWYRTFEVFDIDEQAGDTAGQIQAQIDAVLAELPETVAPLQAVLDAFAACGGFEYDHCEANATLSRIEHLDITTDDAMPCLLTIDELTIETATAEVLICDVQQMSDECTDGS